jgi:hypothetical protein
MEELVVSPLFLSTTCEFQVTSKYNIKLTQSSYILEEICNTLNKPPVACSEVMDMAVDPLQPQPSYHPNYGWTIALIMVIVTIFFLIAVRIG